VSIGVPTVGRIRGYLTASGARARRAAGFMSRRLGGQHFADQAFERRGLCVESGWGMTEMSPVGTMRR